MARTLVYAECGWCGKTFERELGEVNRAKKVGWGSYCSRSHATLAVPQVNHETRRPMSKRLWLKVQKGDGCWEFTGSKNSYGYGILIQTIDGRRHERLAHRVSWEVENGPIPAGLFVCHHCDNRPCCNPAHLYAGTPADNVADRERRGHGRGGRPRKIA